MNSLTRATTNHSVPAATTTTTSSFDTTTKKKFGKNLNKLTAPPTAPVAQGHIKPNASSKNGLLLLSTKRLSSGNNSATATGGILSSKSSQSTTKPIPSLGLHTEFSSSTHDALLGVVVGASRLEAQQQPDAWGVAEKQQQQLQLSQDQQQIDSDLASKTRVEYSESREAPSSTEKSFTSNTSPSSELKNEKNVQKKERSSDESCHEEFRTSNWDEYGGRDLQAKNGKVAKNSVVTVETNNDQNVFMSKLARERAEKKRDEEENRMMEQKERAAQRLKELEEKMAAKKKETCKKISHESENPVDISVIEGKSRSRTVLEKLERKDSVPVTSPTRERNSHRTLYDPNATNKSYSSLVAGSSPSIQERSPKIHESNTKKQSLPMPSPANIPQSDTYSADPESFDRQSVIQLISYDDRDRGDRNASSVPRMLYDPKSGSMVQVISREESASNTRNRKERGKRNKTSREKQSKKDLLVDVSCADTKGGKKNKTRKDNAMSNQRGKEGCSESSSTFKSDCRKIKIDPRKLPRTCGVLYSRDKKGGFFCVDGCEGDLGYGVHSVPGGRVKNSEAYSDYIDSQNKTKQDITDNYHTMNYNVSSNSKNKTRESGQKPGSGFCISELAEPKHDWIKPNEKIELITGIDESPTLQATAKEWAPSLTAFALADREKVSVSSVGSLEDDEDDMDGEEKLTPLGLGFDPALNMNSVMQSPSIDPSDGLDAVDLTKLALEPTLKGPAKTSHIFAFESGATWGTNDSGGNNDWGVHSGNTFENGTIENGGLRGTFLSLSSRSTWGGFGTSLNGDSSKSSGE